MRVVVDTNILISAAIKAQTIPNIAVYRATQRGVLLKSHVTEAELVEVIDRPYLARLISVDARNRLLQLMAMAELVTIAERFTACRDSKDDKFLELAVNGYADLILTGDNDLLVLNPFRAIGAMIESLHCRARSLETRPRRVAAEHGPAMILCRIHELDKYHPGSVQLRGSCDARPVSWAPSGCSGEPSAYRHFQMLEHRSD